MSSSIDSLLSDPAAELEQIDILVIDDDEAIRSLLTEILHDRGYSLRCAPEGKTALRLLSAHTFRLVITDIYMPDMDGIEVIMRYTENNPEVPILAISGGGHFGGPDSMLRPAQILGCWKTLAKPFDLKEFLSVVEQFIGKR